MKDILQNQQVILTEIAKRITHFYSNKLNIPKNLPREAYIIGAGKSSAKMAQNLIENGVFPIDGIIIGPESADIPRIQVFEGNHPYPDEISVASSYELRDFVRELPYGSDVIFCLSGGASSLLCIPPQGIEIEEIAYLYKLLLNSGADIHQINTVRKHVCELKGGKLALEMKHLNVVTLIESDVPGNVISTVGSGPTVPDNDTFFDAVSILKSYELWHRIPFSIKTHLLDGMNDRIPQNPNKFDFAGLQNEAKIISESFDFIQNIANTLGGKGYTVVTDENTYSDDIKTVSKRICGKAIAIISDNDEIKTPAALIYNGESTVKVKGGGKGGRNQELALMAALSLEGQHPISLLSIDTDGIDGPTDVSGALVNSFTTLNARKKKIMPEEFLQNNDSYHFHEKMETHIKLGATGMNLMDLQILLIG